jgi:peptidoglycan/LPS O-acetylase OafA/YrhL
MHNNKNLIFMLTQNKRLIGIVLAVPLLLLIPFIAMQFSDEVRWSPFDFIIMGVLLLGTGLMCELVLRKVKKREHRIVLCLALLATLFVIWAELAVGIFGTPFAGS